MATELQQQLAKFRNDNIGKATPIYKGAPSLFLDLKEAAKVDVIEIHSAALNGAETLLQYEPKMQNFIDTILHHSTINLQRELKTSQENDLLDKELSGLFAVLTIFASFPSTHLILEYLIRRYRVHEFNAEELIGCMLSEHDSKIFARIVQLSNISNSKWSFLSGVKESGSPLARINLVKQCHKDASLFEVICEQSSKIINTFSNNTTTTLSKLTIERIEKVFSFSTIISLELIKFKPVTDAHVRILFPYIISGLKSFQFDAISDLWRKSQILILSALCETIQLSKDLIKAIVNLIAKSFSKCSEEGTFFKNIRFDFIFLLNIMCMNQKIELSRKIIDKLLNLSEEIDEESESLFITTLKDVEKKCKVDNLSQILLDSIITTIMNDNKSKSNEKYEIFACNLISSRFIEINKIESCLIKILKNSKDFISDDESPIHVDKILKLIAQKYPREFDSSIAQLEKEERENSSLKTLLEKIFIGSSQFQIADIKGNSLFLALHHSSPHIRIEALKYYVNCTQNVTAQKKDDEDVVSLAQASFKLLSDQNFEIAKISWSYENLERISPFIPFDNVFESLLNAYHFWLNKCEDTPSFALPVLESIILSLTKDSLFNYFNTEDSINNIRPRSWLFVSIIELNEYLNKINKKDRSDSVLESIKSHLKILVSKLSLLYESFRPDKKGVTFDLIEYVSSKFTSFDTMSATLLDLYEYISIRALPLDSNARIVLVIVDFLQKVAAKLDTSKSEIQKKILMFNIFLTVNYFSSEKKSISIIESNLDSLISLKNDKTKIFSVKEKEVLPLIQNLISFEEYETYESIQFIHLFLDHPNEKVARLLSKAQATMSPAINTQVILKSALLNEPSNSKKYHDIMKTFFMKSFLNSTIDSCAKNITITTLGKARCLLELSNYLKTMNKTTEYTQQDTILVILSFLVLLANIKSNQKLIQQNALLLSEALASISATLSPIKIVSNSSSSINSNVISIIAHTLSQAGSQISLDSNYSIFIIKQLINDQNFLKSITKALKISSKDNNMASSQLIEFLFDISTNVSLFYPEAASTCLNILTEIQIDYKKLDINKFLQIPQKSELNFDDMCYDSWLESLFNFLSGIDPNVSSNMEQLTTLLLNMIDIDSKSFEKSNYVNLKLKSGMISLIKDKWFSLLDESSQVLIYKSLISQLINNYGKGDIARTLNKVPVKISIILEILDEKVQNIRDNFEQIKLSYQEIENTELGSSNSNYIQDMTIILEHLINSFEFIVTENAFDYGLLSVRLFDLISMINIPEFHSILMIDYCQSLSMDLLRNSFANKLGNFIDLDDTHIDSVKKSKSKTNKVNNKTVASSGYNKSRLNSDVELIVNCLKNSKSANTRSSSLGLLKVLTPLAPESVLTSVENLGKLISNLLNSQEKDTYLSSLNSSHDERDQYLIESIKTFFTVLNSASSNNKNKNSNFTFQQVVQAFLKDMCKFNIYRRKSLLEIIMKALGEDAISPCILTLLGHSMSKYLHPSDDISTESSKFIFFSKNAKRKAKSSMKSSDSEETFQLIIDYSLLVSPKSLLKCLVIILKIARNLIDFINGTNNDLTISSVLPSGTNINYNITDMLNYNFKISHSTSNEKEDIVIKGLAVSKLFVILEFVYEIIENKLFHHQLLKYIHDNNLGFEVYQSDFFEFSESCLELLSAASANNLINVGSLNVYIGNFSTKVSGKALSKNLKSWSLQLLHTIQKLLDIPSFVSILQELLNHGDIVVRQKALMVLAERLDLMHLKSKTEPEEVSLFLDLMIYLRNSMKSSSENIFNLINKSKKNIPTNELNLFQSSIMCVDTLVRSLGQDKNWQPEVFISLNETYDLSTKISALCVKHKSSHELMKVLGTLYLCCSTICAAIKAKSLPVLTKIVTLILDSLEYYDLFISSEHEHDNSIIRGSILLIRSILSALASIINELPNFYHPYISRTLILCLKTYQNKYLLPFKDENELVKRDIDRCIQILNSSIPSRHYIPALLNGIPDFLGNGHLAAHRFCQLLSDTWGNLNRETVTQYLSFLNSIATLTLDYRRAFGDRTYQSNDVDDAAANAIVTLNLKFTEIELRSFLSRLAEWKDLSGESGEENKPETNKVGYEWKNESRSVVFFNLLSKLGVKLKSLFIPTAGIFWDNMKEALVDFSKLSTQVMKIDSKGKKRKSNGEEIELLSNIDSIFISESVLKVSHVLDCIKNCCIYSVEGFMDEIRYESIMPEIASLIPHKAFFDEDQTYLDFVDDHLSPCITSLASSIGNDLMWKPLNHRVLMNMRDKKPVVRLAALKILHKLFSEIGEEYLILLPECLPYLSELLEDDSEAVLEYSKEVIRYIETISGENLEDYLH